jgi:hypothetical protein
VFPPHLIDEVHALMARHDDRSRVLDVTSHKFFADFLVAASASATYIKASSSSGMGSGSSPGPSTGTGTPGRSSSGDPATGSGYLGTASHPGSTTGSASTGEHAVHPGKQDVLLNSSSTQMGASSVTSSSDNSSQGRGSPNLSQQGQVVPMQGAQNNLHGNGPGPSGGLAMGEMMTSMTSKSGITSSYITLNKILGAGSFGTVYAGEWVFLDCHHAHGLTISWC